jgi:hypothetical protein
VSIALAGAEKGKLPAIEATRKVIEHYNRGKLAQFDEAHYFVFGGVKVFEEGKREEAERKEGRTSQDIVWGKT